MNVKLFLNSQSELLLLLSKYLEKRQNIHLLQHSREDRNKSPETINVSDENSAQTFFPWVSFLLLFPFDFDVLRGPALAVALIRSQSCRVHLLTLFIILFLLLLPDNPTLFFDFVLLLLPVGAGSLCWRRCRAGGECGWGQQVFYRHRCLLHPRFHLTVAVTEKQKHGECYINEYKRGRNLQ